jgi:hypothetical protein
LLKSITKISFSNRKSRFNCCRNKRTQNYWFYNSKIELIVWMNKSIISTHFYMWAVRCIMMMTIHCTECIKKSTGRYNKNRRLINLISFVDCGCPIVSLFLFIDNSSHYVRSRLFYHSQWSLRVLTLFCLRTWIKFFHFWLSHFHNSFKIKILHTFHEKSFSIQKKFLFQSWRCFFN